MIKQARFALSVLTVWCTIALSLQGGWWLLSGLALTYSLMLAGDLLIGDEDYADYTYSAQGAFDAVLLVAVPSVLLMLSLLALLAQPQDGWLPARQWLQAAGIDIAAAASASQWWHLVAGVLSAGLVTGACGTCIAHELVHCFDSAVKRLGGRVLLALSLDPAFSIDHIYGHHLNVATWSDPTSARRGESSFHFLGRSFVQGNINAWQLEARRLRRQGRAAWSWRNQYLQNLAMCALVLVWAYALGGAIGLALWVGAGLWAQTKVGLVNYVQHYGLVRVPGTRVQPRHAWNSNRWISSSLLINLYLHSQHHNDASLRFWQLSPRRDLPLLPHGTLVMVLMAMTPHLWFWIMREPIARWDREFADEQELALLRGEPAQPQAALPTATA